MNEVSFVDTTFRDGHASLWAEGMTTGMMLTVASQMDRIGFKSIELIASSHFLKCIRELHENPLGEDSAGFKRDHKDFFNPHDAT